MQFSHKCCIYAILLNNYFKFVNPMLNKEPVKRAEKSIKQLTNLTFGEIKKITEWDNQS